VMLKEVSVLWGIVRTTLRENLAIHHFKK